MPGLSLRAVKDALVSALLVISCLACGAAGWAFYRAGLVAKEAEQQARANGTDLRRVILSAGGAVAEIRKAAKDISETSASEKKYWADSSVLLEANLRHSDQALQSFNTLVAHTDAELNLQVLPEMRTTVAAVGDSTVKTEADIHAVMVASQATLQALHDRIADPQLDQTAASLEKTSEHIEASTGNLEAASGDIRQAVHRMTRPAPFAERVGEKILGIAAAAGQVFLAWFK